MIGSKHTWNWGACGKHPVGRDYFSIGLNDPILKAFSDWIDSGYHRLNPEHGSDAVFHSWRFWAKGPKKGSLVCGVGRDSSDDIGRPYPFLIMGTGALKGWEEHWDLLPDVFGETWRQMEYMSAKRFSDFEQFESEVRLLRPPVAKWSELKSEDRWVGLAWDDREAEKKASRLSQDKVLFTPLDCEPTGDPQDQAGLWHSFLKIRISDPPSAMFMGGASEGNFLAVFRRALMPDDFVRLWSAGKGFEAGGQGSLGSVGGHRFRV